MSGPIDPYRTLGVQPGASADEIRRAYRRLAKANHPDSAGEDALPRFLAIQAAYEMLIVGRSRRGAGRGTPAQRPPGPWQADSARARATRNAYSRRQRTGRPADEATDGADTGAGGAAGAAGAPGPSTGRGPRTSGASDRSDRPKRPGGRSRAPNKATMGSTSYDAAEDEPFEPDWSGGTWYGASSGTYWTINPKEYADPRKHGPEYQRRARRVFDGVDSDPADGPSIAGDDLGGPESETTTGEDRSRFDGRWAYPDVDNEAGPRRATSAEPDTGWVPPRSTEPAAPRPSLGETADRLLAGDVGPLGRLALAFVGWAPLAGFVSWLAGELSGCGRFTASCAEPSGPGLSIALFVLIGVLAAAPQLAAISAAGAVGTLAVSIPAAVILSAAGGARQPDAASAVINVAAVVGYVAGVVLATARRLGWRRVP